MDRKYTHAGQVSIPGKTVYTLLFIYFHWSLLRSIHHVHITLFISKSQPMCLLQIITHFSLVEIGLRDANSIYIGKTIRHLATRVREHTTSPSAIKEHLSSCTTCKDNYLCNSFKVIDSANSDFEVSIKEALHIKHKNPNLNKQLSTQGMSFMLKIFT